MALKVHEIPKMSFRNFKILIRVLIVSKNKKYMVFLIMLSSEIINTIQNLFFFRVKYYSKKKNKDRVCSEIDSDR